MANLDLFFKVLNISFSFIFHLLKKMIDIGDYLGTIVAIKKLFSNSFSKEIEFQKYMKRELAMLQ